MSDFLNELDELDNNPVYQRADAMHKVIAVLTGTSPMTVTGPLWGIPTQLSPFLRCDEVQDGDYIGIMLMHGRAYVVENFSYYNRLPEGRVRPCGDYLCDGCYDGVEELLTGEPSFTPDFAVQAVMTKEDYKQVHGVDAPEKYSRVITNTHKVSTRGTTMKEELTMSINNEELEVEDEGCTCEILPAIMSVARVVAIKAETNELTVWGNTPSSNRRIKYEVENNLDAVPELNSFIMVLHRGDEAGAFSRISYQRPPSLWERFLMRLSGC